MTLSKLNIFIFFNKILLISNKMPTLVRDTYPRHIFVFSSATPKESFYGPFPNLADL